MIYQVQSGRLEVSRELADGGNEVPEPMEPGNYVGELGPIRNLPRSAPVRAVEDSVVSATRCGPSARIIPTTVVGQSPDS